MYIYPSNNRSLINTCLQQLLTMRRIGLVKCLKGKVLNSYIFQLYCWHGELCMSCRRCLCCTKISASETHDLIAIIYRCWAYLTSVSLGLPMSKGNRSDVCSCVCSSVLDAASDKDNLPFKTACFQPSISNTADEQLQCTSRRGEISGQIQDTPLGLLLRVAQGLR